MAKSFPSGSRQSNGPPELPCVTGQLTTKAVASLSRSRQFTCPQSLATSFSPGKPATSSRPLKYPSLVRSGVLRRMLGSHF